MARKEDRRVRRTRDLVRGALFALIQAETYAANATADFIERVGFEPSEGGAQPQQEDLGKLRGAYESCHPNNHVNASQSTNDVCPTAIATEFSGNRSYCQSVVQPFCGPWGTLPGSPGTRVDNPYYYYCQAVPQYTCPGGYSWEEAVRLCTVAPTCPPGSTFDNVVSQCTTPPNMICPTGYAADNVLRICTMVPECPPGGSFQSSANWCESDPCPTGYLYNAATGFCERCRRALAEKLR